MIRRGSLDSDRAIDGVIDVFAEPSAVAGSPPSARPRH
jgi:hypothetical protein